jgi:anaerobic magnesium-protoporphyrin IX monomethyl ester cyclase
MEQAPPSGGGPLVVLVNPRSMKGIGASTLPMGLLMVSVHLVRTCRVVIIDQSVEPDWRGRLAGLLAEKPVCVGITAMTGRQISEGLVVSALARRAGVPVVWGGIHPTLLPRQTLEHPLIDFVVEGEGEETLPELLEALLAGRDPGGIAGLWSKRDGAIAHGGPREFVDLGALPPVPYHLLDLSRYVKPGPRGPTLSLYTSRGCPQRCTFCYNRLVHFSRWRGLPAEQVVSDVRGILARHPEIRHLQFWDDNFFANLPRAREIAEGMAGLGPAFSWSALGAHVKSLRRMDDEYLEFLRRSRLTDVLVGVESGAQRMIDLVNKNFRKEDLFLVNQRLGQYGIRPTYTFISGIPEETDADIEETLDTMFRLRDENREVVLGNIKPFVCYPGSELYTRALAMGFRPPATLEAWSTFVWGNYARFDIPWVTPRRRRYLAHLYYYTVLLNPEYLFIDSKIFSFGARLLLPLTIWRLRNRNFALPVESWMMHQVNRLLT